MTEDYNHEFTKYCEFILEFHPDCSHIAEHGADDGLIIAYEKNFMLDEFMEHFGYSS